MRIQSSSQLLPEVHRGRPVKVMVNGQWVEAFDGEAIAAVLLSEGIFIFRHSPKTKEARSIYCGMGLCQECLVTVDEVHAVLACVTPIIDGMQIDTDNGFGA